MCVQGKKGSLKIIKCTDTSVNLKVNKRKANQNQTKTKNFPEKCELKIKADRVCEGSANFFILRSYSDKGIEISPMVV